MILSGGSVDFNSVGQLEGAETGEGEPQGNLEVTRVGNKLGISDGEVTGYTIRVSDRSKLGGYEGSGNVL